jgi:anoctamin-10
VAYLGLALSAFVYVPFGETVMGCVQSYLFEGYNGSWSQLLKGNMTSEAFKVASMNATEARAGSGQKMWEMDSGHARQKLNPSRLADQMFAYTVTNQVVNTFFEIGLPFILRAVSSFQSNKAGGSKNGGKKKRVVFEDEVPVNGNGEKGERGGKEEREFLETVRKEVALPEYELFGDYSEMVTQFGYVALWSTIWPLAPGKPPPTSSLLYFAF